MNEESKKATKSGKYSALEISFIAISEYDVLFGSLEAETGVIWGDGNEGWNVFD